MRSIVQAILLACSAGALAGCSTPAFPLDPPPYRLLSVDESMSCNAMTASFMFAANRAARLEFWLAEGPLPGYGFERFPLDAPRKLEDELARLDALTDLQRTRGCPVLDPRGTVARERARIEQQSGRRSPPPVVLQSRG